MKHLKHEIQTNLNSEKLAQRTYHSEFHTHVMSRTSGREMFIKL